MTPNRSSASSTLLLIAPMVSKENERGRSPERLTRPYVGEKPTTPRYAAGRMVEPPVCVAMLAGTIRAATLTAEPLDEPLAVRERFQGLWAGDGSRPANCVVCTLPRTMAPAARNRAIHVASTPGSRSRNGLKFALVGSPRVKSKSFTEASVSIQGHPRLEHRLLRGDAFQERLDKRHRRQASRTHARQSLRCGQLVQRKVHRFHVMSLCS